MRLLLSTIFTLGLALPAMAQDVADPGNQTGTSLTDLFAFGETVVFDYDPLDISEQIQQLTNEACAPDADEEREATISDCTFGPDSDFPREVSRHQEERLAALIAIQSRITVARAETEAARFEGIRARAIELRNQAQLEAGTVYSPEEYQTITDELQAVRQELVEMEAEQDSADRNFLDLQAEAEEHRAALQVMAATILSVCNDSVAEADEAICDDFEGMVSAPEVVRHVLGTVAP